MKLSRLFASLITLALLATVRARYGILAGAFRGRGTRDYRGSRRVVRDLVDESTPGVRRPVAARSRPGR